MMTAQHPPLLSGAMHNDQHELAVRVYFEDTDFSGVVYHARYLHFLERGRSDFLRLKNINHHQMRDGMFGEPVFFVVKSLAIDFNRAAQIDDVLHIVTTLNEVKGVRLLMEQKIERRSMAECELIATARVSVVLINNDGRPRRLPAALKTALDA